MKALSPFLKYLLCQFFGYYNGKQYKFTLDSNKNLMLIEATGRTRAVLIVSRAFYKEQAKEYPIANKAELKKLLKLELSDQGQSYFHHWTSQGEKSQVNIWQFDKSVPNTTIVLPETLLFALTADEHQITVISDKNNADYLYISRLAETVLSLPASSLINSCQRFSAAVGVAQLKSARFISNSLAGFLEPEDCAREKSIVETKKSALSKAAFTDELAHGIKKLSLPIIGSFVQLPKNENRLQLLKNIAIPWFFALSLYLALSSVYLLAKQDELQQQLSSQSEEVSKALDEQTLFDQQQSQYSAIKKFLVTRRNKSPLWLVIPDLFPQAQFSNIRVVADRFVLRGSTLKATNLLELLSKNPQVIDAKFDFPTRKQRNRDNFVISFTLHTELANEKAINTDKEVSIGG